MVKLLLTFDLDLGAKLTEKHCPVPSTSWDLCTCKVWSCCVQRFRRYILQENSLVDLWTWPKVTHNVALYPLHHETYVPVKFEEAKSNYFGDAFTRKYIIWLLTLTLVSRPQKKLPSTLYIMWTTHLQSLKLLRPTVWEKMHLQENTLLELVLKEHLPSTL